MSRRNVQHHSQGHPAAASNQSHCALALVVAAIIQRSVRITVSIQYRTRSLAMTSDSDSSTLLAHGGPVSDISIFDEDNVRNPHPMWSTLRELGSVVYLSTSDTWVITRYDEVRATLADWQTYSSAAETVYGEEMGALLGKVPLTTDPPLHDRLRGILSAKTAPRALKQLGERVAAHADELVAEAVEAGSIEAMETLCQRLPVDTVADLVGLPDEGREILLPGGERMLMTFGPHGDRYAAGMPTVVEFAHYIKNVTNRDVLKPDSWGTAILDAVDDGRIQPEDAAPLMSSYLIAGMGTTVHTLGFYLNNLARNPQAWAALKADPSLIGSGFEESIRLDGPAQVLYRGTTREVELGGHVIPDGKRIIVSIGSANRDPRHYSEPDTFDIHRNPVDHLGLGYATHGCVGQGLARLEVRAVMSSLLRRVATLTPAGEPELTHHIPGFSGITRLPITLTSE
ncbi:cytochrome P450 [Rhodococcus sp. WS4]|nr:cytochrome P450 [Rhodococcus sp. WS4]